MSRLFILCSIAALLCSIAFTTAPPTISDGTNFPSFQRQFGRPMCGNCPSNCFPSRRNAEIACTSSCREGTECEIESCRARNNQPGFRCSGRRPSTFQLSPPNIPSLPPFITSLVPPGVLAPNDDTEPVPSVSATPSPSITPSPSLSPRPSVTPTSSATPSVTPSPSITPSPSQMCSFDLVGDGDGNVSMAKCTCGEMIAAATFLAPVTNTGEMLNPTLNQHMEALNCYNGCSVDLLVLACDPGNLSTFTSNGRNIVNICCRQCVSTFGASGTGVSTVTNQCRLVP